MGLNGSKSILTFFSLPSSVTIVPQYITRPFGGTAEKFVYKIKFIYKIIYINAAVVDSIPTQYFISLIWLRGKNAALISAIQHRMPLGFSRPRQCVLSDGTQHR